MQAYRSGHNEAVLKTVWGKPHGGSNPSACATTATRRLSGGCCGIGGGLQQNPKYRGFARRASASVNRIKGRDFTARGSFGEAKNPPPAPKNTKPKLRFGIFLCRQKSVCKVYVNVARVYADIQFPCSCVEVGYVAFARINIHGNRVI